VEGELTGLPLESATGALLIWAGDHKLPPSAGGQGADCPRPGIEQKIEPLERVQSSQVEHTPDALGAARPGGRVTLRREVNAVWDHHDSWTPAYRDPAVLDWLFAQRQEQQRTG